MRYCGKAIRDNKGDGEGMAKAVMATLHHVSSTDNNLMHQYCPQGEYSRGNAKHTKDNMHTQLNATVYKEVKPTYERLSP